MKMKNEIDKYLIQYKELFSPELFINNVSNDLDKAESINTTNLLDYYESIKDCLDCSLGYTRKNFVFGIGNPNAEIVFIGEAPGEQEDLKGLPFVGKSGKLLDKILSAINLDRNDVYILNILKCRPPENRNPSSEEINKCEKYLKKQLKIIKPRVIVALGRIAAQTLLNCNSTLADLRNKTHKYENIDLLVTFHPAALLRNPNLKKDAWEDFKSLKRAYINA